MKRAKSTMTWLISSVLLLLAAAPGKDAWAGIRADRTTATPPAVAATATTRVFLPIVVDGFFDPYVNPFGVVMYGGVNQAAGLPQMQAAGARRVTLLLDWAAIEPAEGVRNWGSFDASVNNARAAGMEVFTLFVGDPQWAWTPARDGTDLQKRINFVRAMVDRYDCDGVNDAGPNMCVRDWSFYAEPDADYGPTATPGAKGWWGNRPQQYAQMLASIAPVVHQEDPRAKVINGGLAYDSFVETTPGGLFRRNFLPLMLAELNNVHGGAARFLDEFAVHYYPLNYASVRDKVVEIRGILQQNGVGNLTIVIPEAGYWSDTALNSSETRQAARVVHFYVESLSVGVPFLSWFDVFDSGNGTPKWGLFRGQDLNSPKPSYTAYGVIATELAGGRYLRGIGQAGVDGGIFYMPNRREKTVAWATGTTGQLVVGGSCVRQAAMLGGASTITDGQPGADQDGQVNGSIRLRLTADQPVYVEACP